MQVSLVWTTPDAEKIIAYCARVSSPHQDNPEYEKLLRYCMNHGHWSIFEMADMCLEITTTRAIAPQILRHRSFLFQEFSQRFAADQGYEAYEARRQDTKNRQNSFDDLDEDTKQWFDDAQADVWQYSYERYETALEKGIAKESARSILPLNTVTRLYMKGNIRNWIHYLRVRTGPDTQKEHRDIALAAQAIFREELPIIGALL